MNWTWEAVSTVIGLGGLLVNLTRIASNSLTELREIKVSQVRLRRRMRHTRKLHGRRLDEHQQTLGNHGRKLEQHESAIEGLGGQLACE